MKRAINLSHPQPKPGILGIEAYVPGANKTFFTGKTYKLSSNESPFNPPQSVINAYLDVAKNLATYPKGDSFGLRQAIAQTLRLSVDNILIGNGSDELLSLLAQAYLAAGDEGIMTEHGFSVYEINIRGAGGIVRKVKESNCRISTQAILDAVSDRTRIIFIANPGNPTGTYLKRVEIADLIAKLPPHILVVLDGAYAEFVDCADFDAGKEFVEKFQNVVMTRTFSKIYALAGLRIGWMYAPSPIIDAVNRIRCAFNVNSAAQAAAAAAVRDSDFLTMAKSHNKKWRDWLSNEIEKIGLIVTPSVTNFLLIHFSGSGKTAQDADRYLNSKGFILRRVDGYGFPNSLRLSIGSEEANRGVVAALKNFLANTDV